MAWVGRDTEGPWGACSNVGQGRAVRCSTRTQPGSVIHGAPGSLSLSGRCSAPFTVSVALCWALSSSSLSFSNRGAQNWTQYSRYGLIRAEQRASSTPHDAVGLLGHRSTVLAQGHPAAPQRLSLSPMLLSSSSAPSPSRYPGFSLPRTAHCPSISLSFSPNSPACPRLAGWQHSPGTRLREAHGRQCPEARGDTAQPRRVWSTGPTRTRSRGTALRHARTKQGCRARRPHLGRDPPPPGGCRFKSCEAAAPALARPAR